jgi:hypothetical protein
VYLIPGEMRGVIDMAKVPGILAEHGLLHLLDGPRAKAITWTGCDIGSGAGPVTAGRYIVVSMPPADPRGKAPVAGYFPDAQEWDPPDEGEDWWLGWERGSPPRPEDLARETMFRGEMVELCDGRQWQIPVVRSLLGHTTLPQLLRERSSGKVERQIKAEYAALFEETARLANAYYGRTTEQVTYEEAVPLVRKALACNYRIGRREAGALKLFDSVATMQGMIDAMADMARYRQFEKDNQGAQKKTDGSTGGGSGNA